MEPEEELASHPKCYVWDDYKISDQTVTWFGVCLGIAARGRGTLTWTMGEQIDSHTGHLPQSKWQGISLQSLIDKGESNEKICYNFRVCYG